MMSKFKQMEQILRSIKEIEESNQRMARAILIIDLKHLKFESNLIGFISGTYRIMWGTLVSLFYLTYIITNTDGTISFRIQKVHCRKYSQFYESSVVSLFKFYPF
jgi:hypothetical protein